MASVNKEEQNNTSKDTAKTLHSSLNFAQLAQLTDRFGNTFYFGNVGNYWHPPFPIPPDSDYRTHVRNIRDMEIRSDDILLSSFPKTGRHWHQEIVKMLMNKSSQYIPHGDQLSQFVDQMSAEKIRELPSPRLLVTHVPFRYLPRQAFEKKIKIVFLDRNPKDTLTSFYSFLHNSPHPYTYTGTFDQFFQLFFEVGCYYGDMFDYLMERQRGMESYSDVNALTVAYEDMKNDPVEGVKKLNEYLGTGCDKLCEDIAAACSFKAMKKVKDADVPENIKAALKGRESPRYRKGVVGDWKNWFTVAQNEKFDAEYKKRMSEYKYQSSCLM